MTDDHILRLAHAELIPWLLECAVREESMDNIVKGYCERMVATGVPIQRFVLGCLVLHPLYGITDYVWSSDSREVAHTRHPRAAYVSDEFLNSPFYHSLANNIDFERYDLRTSPCAREFPIFERFRSLGFTDYCVCFNADGKFDARQLTHSVSKPGSYSPGLVISCATRRASGFSDDDLALIRATSSALSVALRVRTLRDLTSVILETYLGGHSSERVLEGRVTRGDRIEISSIIWVSDLRGSTRLADTMPLERYLEYLNEYFECSAGAVIDHGGDVLKFIGDAVMAIFPIDTRLRRPEIMARAALSAAREALHRSASLARAGTPPIQMGVTLHVGDVSYGNVGTPRRLDFTVIGPAVNVATRMQDLCKSLDASIVASDEFAAIAPKESGLAQVGGQALRGVDRPVTVHIDKEASGG